jgi:hypothetical protein
MDEGGSHVEGPMTKVLAAMVERSGSVVEVLKRPPLGEFASQSAVFDAKTFRSLRGFSGASAFVKNR